MTSLTIIFLVLGLICTIPRPTLSAPARVEVKWRFSANGPIISSPVLRDGMVYFGSLDSVFYAVELATGKQIWSYRTKGEIRSTGCLDSNAVYFSSADGCVYALNRQTGKLIWSFATEQERKYDFADYYQSSPVLQERILYFGSGDGHLYAVDPTGGSLIWKFATGDVVHATPVIDGEKIFVGSFDGFFYALNAKTGGLIWKFKSVGHRYFPKGEFMGSPVLGPGLVYVGARDYNLYALDMEKGFCHWNKSFSRGWALANTVIDSIVYTGTSDDRILMASGVRSGREFWRANLGFNMFGGLACDDSVGYVGTLLGKLYAVRLTDGSTLWSFATDGYNRNHLKYFKDDDSFRDDIFEIVKSDEAFIDVEYQVGAIFSTPLVSGEVILCTSTDGTLYCLKKPDRSSSNLGN